MGTVIEPITEAQHARSLKIQGVMARKWETLIVLINSNRGQEQTGLIQKPV